MSASASGSTDVSVVPAARASHRVAAQARRPLGPETPRLVRVGMPQLDAGGLSDNWLLRHAGDLHWQAIARRMNADTDEIKGVDGQRLYPTVVAVRARYQVPLCAVRENDTLGFTAEVTACGRSCAHGQIEARLSSSGQRFSLELLTTFAIRQASGALRTALPSARLAARWTSLAQLAPSDSEVPQIARLARAARRGEALTGDDFSGPTLNSADDRRPLGGLTVEPSPYSDYNGAGLLYFASYVTMADTAERTIIRRLRRPPAVTSDWALATSSVQRDVFYYANVPLGESVTADLLQLSMDEPAMPEQGRPISCVGGSLAGTGVKTHVRLRNASTGQTIADVVTRRLFVAGERW